MHVEIELKLELLESESLRLRKLWGEPIELLEQRNLYYEDSEDSSLWARQGFAIRLREENGQWILGAKAAGNREGGWSRRAEWERRLPNAEFAGLLLGGALMREELRSLVGELPPILDDSELSLRGELTNTRRKFALPGCGGVVELDHFRLPGGGEGHELEFETGDAELRTRAEAELRSLFDAEDIGWRPSEISKRERFERALRGEEG